MNDDRRYCRCGTQLARDNRASFCSTCQRERRRDSAPAVPPEFWHAEQMGAALASGDLGRVLRAYRTHPFHRQRLPQAVIADWLHVSQSTLSRIERGKRLSVEEVNAFGRVLGVPVALRWTLPIDAMEEDEDVQPISRRSLLGGAGAAALGLTAPTAAASPRPIDPELVRHWMGLMHLLRRHDATSGPHGVLDAVRQELNLIGGHRQSARGELRTELLGVESRWSWFASWLGRDAGDDRIADFCADRALRLAREAEYPDMVAYVLMRRSLWAAPSARQAIALAEAGHSTRGASDYMRALCALRVAHGHALAGDAMACERSLAAAQDLLPDDPMAIDSESPWDGLGSREATPPYVMAEEGRCWLLLHPSRAIDAFEQVLRLWPSERTRGRGIHEAHLALAYAAADEPERAAAEGLRALETARTTGSDVTTQRLTWLDRQLASSDVPTAKDFREAFALQRA